MANRAYSPGGEPGPSSPCGQQVRIRVAYLDREVRRIAVAPSWSHRDCQPGAPAGSTLWNSAAFGAVRKSYNGCRGGTPGCPAGPSYPGE